MQSVGALDINAIQKLMAEKLEDTEDNLVTKPSAAVEQDDQPIEVGCYSVNLSILYISDIIH